MRWRILDTERGSGAMNMAVDEAILLACSRGLVPPTLRFYRWSPPCLSLGYAQSMRGGVDRKRCREEGVDTVRRITGGRAILHHRELTYSLIVPEGSGFLPSSIRESYALLSRGLLAGFRALGLEVSMARGDSRGSSAACFDASSWYEIQIGGRKAAGSAQVRRNGAVLQHGSVPLELDPELMFSLLRFSGDRERIRARRTFRRRATAVNEELGKLGRSGVDTGRLRDVLMEGWILELGMDVEGWGRLTSGELREARRLCRDKYTRDDWNLRVSLKARSRSRPF